MPKKVILGKKPNTDILLEISGTLDNGANVINHHLPEDKAKGLISPGCRKIDKCPEKSIGIDHFDCDVYMYIRRAWGLNLPDIDFGLLDVLDSKGTTFSPDCENSTLMFFYGIQKVASLYGITSCREENRDISSTVKEIMKLPFGIIFELGELFAIKSDMTYVYCMIIKTQDDRFGLWQTDSKFPFDSNRPFKDGFQVVVVYDKTNQKISLRVSHNNMIELAGQTFADIYFAGHPKACGSPKGAQYSLKDAMEVYCDICKKCQKIV